MNKLVMLVLPFIMFFSASSYSEENHGNQSERQLEQNAKQSGAARIRLFGYNGANVILYKNSTCTGGADKIQASGDLSSSFFSFIGSVKNESVGIPESLTTKDMSQRGGMMAKAFYKEYSVRAGEPVTLDMTYGDTSGRSCSPTASSFVPADGVDYEAYLDVDFEKRTCKVVFNQIEKDGALSALKVSSAYSCK